MITIITPTGDRPEAFELTRKWIFKQTKQPDQWLVIDDGKVPLPVHLRNGLEYVRRVPQENEGHTLTLNMRKSLTYIKGDIILIVEDDDWYGPTYVETMSNLLNNYDLVGERFARYYYLPAMKYRRIGNDRHASFCQTGFTRKLLPLFESCLPGDPYIDARLWASVISGSYLITDTEDAKKLHCSFKGLKGRHGIGTGHNENARYYNTDVGLEFLVKWVGEENARIYMGHVGQSFESSRLIGIDKKGHRATPPLDRISAQSKTEGITVPLDRISAQSKTEGITVITCTGDRPEAFVLLRRWMDNQTVKPKQWIVVDDGKEPLKNIEGFEYIRREPTISDYTHTLCLNLEKALATVKGDKIIIMEDDDWYDPTYIEYMSGLLDKADLVGFGNLIFYYPGTHKYMEKRMAKQPAFAQTAFKKVVIPTVQEICRSASKEYELCGKGLIDVFLWKSSLEVQRKERFVRLTASLKVASGKVLPVGLAFYPPIPLGIMRRADRHAGAEYFYANIPIKARKLVATCEKYITVGMKGMPGRKGLTTHHNIENRKYKVDIGGNLLKSILKSDADFYQQFSS
jgi:hypothetical protein